MGTNKINIIDLEKKEEYASFNGIQLKNMNCDSSYLSPDSDIFGIS